MKKSNIDKLFSSLYLLLGTMILGGVITIMVMVTGISGLQIVPADLPDKPAIAPSVVSNTWCHPLKDDYCVYKKFIADPGNPKETSKVQAFCGGRMAVDKGILYYCPPSGQGCQLDSCFVLSKGIDQ